MSTVKKLSAPGRASVNQRFSQLASLGEVVFHIDDLAVLWGIQNANTLHTTLKRYAQQHLLHRVWRGMYSLRIPTQVDPLLLGLKALHRYAYVGGETVLFQAGIINQRPTALTLVSDVSSRFTIGDQSYLCRQLADQYLYQTVGISETDGIRRASVERAIADMLYLNPKVSFDAPIHWPAVRRIQRIMGYPVTPMSRK
jgi:hypothetical protein